MSCRNIIAAFAALLAVALASPASAQNVRSYRCDDGIRPFIVSIRAVDERTLTASGLDGASRTMRITQNRGGALTFAGGRGNEYNMTFNVRGDRASLNKPNSETIECALVRTAQAAPGPNSNQGSADSVRRPNFCANPANEAQFTICDSTGLSNLNTALAAAYRRAIFDSPGSRGEIDQEQRRFAGRRDSCGANTGCLTRRYREQIALLEGFFNN